MTIHFDKKLFWWLFITFICSTIIGTLSHECGHYFIAKWLGYDPNLHFARTSWRSEAIDEYTQANHGFWILISGPLQTLSIGTLGLVLLYLYRQTFYQTNSLSISQWVIIFLSLFWTRQFANYAIWTWNKLSSTNFKSNSDEIQIARQLQLPEGVILTFSALIGLIVLVVVIFRFIPEKLRLSFMSAGLFGGVFGYIVWMKWLGPWLIP